MTSATHKGGNLSVEILCVLYDDPVKGMFSFVTNITHLTASCASCQIELHTKSQEPVFP
jgi:hypothetical protein